MSNFDFLKAEWPDLFESARNAERLAYADPRAACFYARRTIELEVFWLYKHDTTLHLPYQEQLNALIHEPTFRKLVGPTVGAKIDLIRKLGNLAVHSAKPIRQYDALTALREVFHVGWWLAHSYARGTKPADGLAFKQDLLPTQAAIPQKTLEQLQNLEQKLHEKDEKLTALLSDKQNLDAQLAEARAQIAAIKKANATAPDKHDYSEAQTRDYFIDLLLKEAGWTLDQQRDTEFPVTGMPNESGAGFVDYVLWGNNGLPLALVEAKRTTRDARAGQQQAKLYADCLEKQFGQRPIIFYSNGYEHWIWDDSFYPPRAVQGFYKKDELELLILRRQTRRSLAEEKINEAIIERYYQTRAVRRIGESFEKDCLRKALVVMATGSGKTRTVIALCDLLMRCNWAKRALFLADRVALVNQTVNAFKKHLPESPPVNLVTEKETDGRIFISTYPTMMGLIDETKNGQRRFGPGHFDLVIIDEAHRSVFQKYRAIFGYFDSLLVGLTATPRDEIDRNTYSLFELEDGVPTDAYPLEDAVSDKYLVPPKSISVPLKFQREGIKYDDLPEEEKEEWDAKEWDEEGEAPEKVEAEAINKWLFNIDTVDKALAHLMTRGMKVAGGDRLGKTIVFARNQAHAEFIAERFNANYPHYKGEFARVITFKTEYAQSLIDDFSKKDKAPHMAISVDMLDTGIDVPEVVNLVFFKPVRSKTKFWQMVGRGTRLCKDLFGPDQHKVFFYIFDCCHNLEYFSIDTERSEGTVSEPLGKRIFKARLELIGELDKKLIGILQEGGWESHLRSELTEQLRTEVAAMNLENFVVRPHRRHVEKFAKAESWNHLTLDGYGELAHHVAGLPTELPAEDEEAKRFDLLMLNLQLAVMKAEPAFKRLKEQVMMIAALLEEKSSIPVVKEQLALLQELQMEEWWENVTPPMLETVRRRIRSLVKLIEKKKHKPIYTNFQDQLGEEKSYALPGFTPIQSFERFRAKAQHFLKQHENHLTIHKLRHNEALTSADLAALETMLSENSVGSADDIEKAKAESDGLGLFVRSLVGLDRHAAKEALSLFMGSRQFSAPQIEFLDEIVNHLTEHGFMPPERLYESPYTDLNPQGIEGLFTSSDADQIFHILEEIRCRAVA
ncbi:MAG: DEAD/DEAH box helicase family protein [Verrucomicrobiales bacterium]